jgi:hypothetical protein
MVTETFRHVHNRDARRSGSADSKTPGFEPSGCDYTASSRETSSCESTRCRSVDAVLQGNAAMCRHGHVLHEVQRAPSLRIRPTVCNRDDAYAWVKPHVALPHCSAYTVCAHLVLPSTSPPTLPSYYVDMGTAMRCIRRIVGTLSRPVSNLGLTHGHPVCSVTLRCITPHCDLWTSASRSTSSTTNTMPCLLAQPYVLFGGWGDFFHRFLSYFPKNLGIFLEISPPRAIFSSRLRRGTYTFQAQCAQIPYDSYPTMRLLLLEHPHIAILPLPDNRS